MTTPDLQQIQEAIDIEYAIAKQVSDMRSHGFSVATNYGDIQISADEGKDIATQVQRVLEDRLARMLGKQPGIDVLSAEQKLMVSHFDACDQDRQNFVLLMSHLSAGNPCTSEMSQWLTQLGDAVAFDGGRDEPASPISHTDVSTAFNQIFGVSK